MGLDSPVLTDIDLIPTIVDPIADEAISAFCLALIMACPISVFLTLSSDLSETLKSTPLMVLAPAVTEESIQDEILSKFGL